MNKNTLCVLGLVCIGLPPFSIADSYYYSGKEYSSFTDAKHALESNPNYLKVHFHSVGNKINNDGNFVKKYKFYGVAKYCFFNREGLNGFTSHRASLTAMCSDNVEDTIKKTIARSLLNCQNRPGYNPRILNIDLSSKLFSFDLRYFGYPINYSRTHFANDCSGPPQGVYQGKASIGTKGQFETIEVIKDNIKEAGQTCAAAGNPISLAIGNKFQVVNDFISPGSFPLQLTRTYNSYTGEWYFNYTQSITTSFRVISAVHADGKVLSYKMRDAYRGDPDIFNTIEPFIDSSGNRRGWKYTKTDHTVEIYNRINKLSSITDLNSGLTQTLTYKDRSITITASLGESLTLYYNHQKQIIKAQYRDHEWHYGYSEAGNLEKVTNPDGTFALYHYEDERFPHKLTGITDSNGVRFATWKYDDKGRATSSEHAGGTEKTTLEFHSNNSTTVTNPLGKKTTYHFNVINGVHKVVKVEGQQTEHCAAANKEYTYYDNGLLKSKTDWKGNTTAFKYNDQGLAIEMTEAVGTPQARTVTTEWDVDKRLPLKTSDGQVETSYQYDEHGALVKKRQQLVQ